MAAAGRTMCLLPVVEAVTLGCNISATPLTKHNCLKHPMRHFLVVRVSMPTNSWGTGQSQACMKLWISSRAIAKPTSPKRPAKPKLYSCSVLVTPATRTSLARRLSFSSPSAGHTIDLHFPFSKLCRYNLVGCMLYGVFRYEYQTLLCHEGSTPSRSSPPVCSRLSLPWVGSIIRRHS